MKVSGQLLSFWSMHVCVYAAFVFLFWHCGAQQPVSSIAVKQHLGPLGLAV
jgi:hypothetical protein